MVEASIYGASPVLIKTFLSKVRNVTSFERQISVIQTREKIWVINVIAVKKARISRFFAKMAKKRAR